MKIKINIADILKDKPQGTKLYDLLYNIDVESDTISTTDTETVVWCINETDNNTTCHRGYSEFGTVRGCSDGLQILLPSKEMRDWRKFDWKKGDVLVNSSGFKLFFDRWANDDYTRFFGKVNLLEDSFSYETEKYTLASKEETLDTFEIEKPEFKDGDIVCISGMGYLAYGIVKSIDNSNKKLEYYVLNDMSTLKFEDWLSFEDKQIQPITETQQTILFDALTKENKRWDAEKKQIVDLKPEVELKPFDKVWVKDNPYGSWEPALFWKKVDVIDLHPYMVIGGKRYRFCEPYEGNEHLLDD